MVSGASLGNAHSIDSGQGSVGIGRLSLHGLGASILHKVQIGTFAPLSYLLIYWVPNSQYPGMYDDGQGNTYTHDRSDRRGRGAHPEGL